MKQASLSSSIVQGGGKRRGEEGMLHREARSLNARSCNYPTTCALQRPTRRSNHANLREDRCNIGRSWRNRSRQCGSSRSLVRPSLLPSSLWLLSPSSLWLLPSPSFVRLSPLLPSSLLPPSLLVLARSFCMLRRCSGR